MLTVEIPIKDPKKPPVLKFAERCVNCGKPKETVMPLQMHMGVQKRGQMVTMDLPVPLCNADAQKERSIAKATLVPFLIAGLVIGAIAFVPAWLVAPQGTTPQTMNFDLVFGAFVGLIVGILGGTLVEFVLKVALAPVFGQLLLKRPLTAVSVFNDSEDVIGLSMKLSKDKKSLNMTFENDEIAREFEDTNRAD